MNRFISAFLVAMVSSTVAFSQSTNFTGTGTETIGFTNLSFSGAPGGNAASLSAIAALNSVNTSYDGGNGQDNVTAGAGGRGLNLVNAGVATFIDQAGPRTEIRGGRGGTVDTLLGGTIAINGGSGINMVTFNPSYGIVLDKTDVYAGNGGSAVGINGNTVQAQGGDGIFTLVGGLINLNQSTVQGGNGGSVTAVAGSANTASKATGGNGIIKSAGVVLGPLSDGVALIGGNGGSYTSLSGNNAYVDTSGGNGLQATANSTSNLVINGGVYRGGNGGTSVGSATVDGKTLADGGDGIIYGGAGARIVISGGTFVGGAGGSAQNKSAGTQADGGDALTLNGSAAEISGGDFSGGSAGSASGSAEEGVGLKLIDASADISGGTFDTIRLTGTGNNSLAMTGGSVGGFLLDGTATAVYDLSLGVGAVVVEDQFLQVDGTANVSQWTDAQFQDITLLAGSINFSGQAYNHQAGSSLELLDVDSVATFSGGFTARSNSTVTTSFDGSSSSTIAGSDLTIEPTAAWNVDGGTVPLENGDQILLATASSSLTAVNLDDGDLNYVGAASGWLPGLTFDPRGLQLWSVANWQDFDDAFGLDPDSEFGGAMDALSDFTDLRGSNPSQYLTIKNPFLSENEAFGLLKSQFSGETETAGTLIRQQSLLADQITDRSRSRLNNAHRVNAPYAAPQGARGFDAAMEDAEAWGSGFGSFLDQNETSDFGGYEATIGGAALGVDKNFGGLVLGLGGGYMHSVINGGWGSDGEIDTVYGSAYASMKGDRSFLDLNVNYGFSEVETEGSAIVGDYSGEYDASTVSMRIGGGIGFPLFNDNVLLTPEASLLSTFYSRDSYTQTSPVPAAQGEWPDLMFDDYDDWSYLGSLGATLTMLRQVEYLNLDMGIHPELRLHYLHEFNAEMENPTYTMESTTDPAGTPIEAVLQPRDEDLIKLGFGLRFFKWQSYATEVGLDFDLVFGEDYEAYIGGAKLIHRF